MSDPLFSAEEISELRTEFSGYLPDTCVIYNKTKSSDGMGGETETYTPGTTYKCRLQVESSQGKEESSNSRQQASIPYTVILPYNAVVRRSDRISVKGMMLEVISTGQHSDNLTLPVHCMEVG